MVVTGPRTLHFWRRLPLQSAIRTSCACASGVLRSFSSRLASRHFTCPATRLMIWSPAASRHCCAEPPLHGHIQTGVPDAGLPHCTSRHWPPMPRIVPSGMNVHCSLAATLLAQLTEPSSQVLTSAPGLVDAHATLSFLPARPRIDTLRK